MKSISLFLLLAITSSAASVYAEDDKHVKMENFCRNIGVIRSCNINTKKYEVFIYDYIDKNKVTSSSNTPFSATEYCNMSISWGYEAKADTINILRNAKTNKQTFKQYCNETVNETNAMMKEMKK